MSAVPAIGNADLKIKVYVGGKPFDKVLITQERYTVGRDPSNDLVIETDPQVSRFHAVFYRTQGVWCVKHVSDKNTPTINEMPITDVQLPAKGVFAVGLVRIEFEVIGQIPNINSPIHQEAKQGVRNIRSEKPTYAPLKPRKNNPLILWTVIAILILAVVYFWTEKDAQKKKRLGLRSEIGVAQDLEKSEKAVSEWNAEIEKKGLNTPQYKKAQEHYMKGFRDFRQGQFARAIQSFQAALAFYPDHLGARRYLNLAQVRLDELTQFHMNLGRQYRDKGNYTYCAYHFKNVMRLLQTENEALYNEANTYMKECIVKSGRLDEPSDTP